MVMVLQLLLLLYCTVIVHFTHIGRNKLELETAVPLVPVLCMFPVFECVLEKCDRDHNGLNTLQ